MVIVVDGETGTVKWKHRTGVALVNTVAPIDSNQVVITDMDGRVMMLVKDVPGLYLPALILCLPATHGVGQAGE